GCQSLSLNLGRLIARSAHFDLEVIEIADRLFLDLPHHRLEHREALALVFNQRVTLRHRTKTDASFEVVHLVEVVTPATVKNLQHYPALELTSGRLAERFFARLVRDRRVREKLASQTVSGDPALAS